MVDQNEPQDVATPEEKLQQMIDEDLIVCKKLADPTLFIETLIGAIKSPETIDNLMQTLEGIKKQLKDIFRRHPLAEQNKKCVQMAKAIDKSCNEGISKQANNNPEAIKVLEEQMDPAIKLSKQCAITAERFRVILEGSMEERAFAFIEEAKSDEDDDTSPAPPQSNNDTGIHAIKAPKSTEDIKVNSHKPDETEPPKTEPTGAGRVNTGIYGKLSING